MVVARSVRGRARDDAATGDTTGQRTSRQREVLDALGQGLPPKLIARSLGITVQTCRGYIKNIMAKLGTGTQLETVVAAQRLGILRVPQDA